MADSGENIDLGDITKMKVADLKKELKLRGLDSNGNKSQLIHRLQTAVGEIAETDSMLADPDTDEILDEDEVLADETLDDEMDEIQEENLSPELSRNPKRKHADKASDSLAPIKKITLNRTAVVSSSENEIDDPESKEEKSDEAKEGRKVIKLSDFTVQERLEKRAAKFGVVAEVSSDARKEARAIRFGITSTASATSNSTVPTSALEQLKKRSERFGTSVSSIMTKAEEDEKKQKRRERFGLVEPSNGNAKTTKVTSSTTSSSTKVPITFGGTDSNDTDEKKKQRAERFKIKI